MVQVYVEVSGNLPVVFYVKQGQGDKERLDLDKDINTTPWSSKDSSDSRGGGGGGECLCRENGEPCLRLSP